MEAEIPFGSNCAVQRGSTWIRRIQVLIQLHCTIYWCASEFVAEPPGDHAVDLPADLSGRVVFVICQGLRSQRISGTQDLDNTNTVGGFQPCTVWL